MKFAESMPETLTTRETAALLGASVRTIQLWVEDGRLQAWKTPGGHRRVLRSSIEEMLENRRRASGLQERVYEILVVEDDAVQLVLMEKTLGNLSGSTHVRTSSDGYDALIRVGELRPDLLVTDLMMPGMDGIRLLQTLAREITAKPMQVIVVTALDADEVVALGGLPNGVSMLRKPVRAATLLSLAKAYQLAWQVGGK